MELPRGLSVRRDAKRGRFANAWLDARFSFSFGDWHDADWQHFGPLLAINEDFVRPGRGFAMHPHRDLEILMLPRSGRIEHRDSEGGHAVVGPGDLHFMRAGRGIRHSQMNPSDRELDHHFQIWLEPRTRGLDPAVRTLRLPAHGAGEWIVLASGRGSGGVAIDTDADVMSGRVEAGVPLGVPTVPGGRRYLHLMRGIADVAGVTLAAGDALADRDGDADLVLRTDSSAEALFFDLPPSSDGPGSN
jgi:hypothetical protein